MSEQDELIEYPDAIQNGLPFQEHDYRGFIRKFKFPEGADTHDLYYDRNNRPRRHKPTMAVRTTPCEWCGFPLSQRHHFLPVAIYGENDITAQLCANCHEIYHVVERGLRKQSKTNTIKLGLLIRTFGQDDSRILNAYRWTLYVQQLEKKHGLKRTNTD